jgi:hypothetical protein
MSFVALVVVYGNLAVAFNPQKLGLAALPSLPTGFALRDAFLVTGMFTGYATHNSDPFLEGFVRDRFVPLDLREHFPLRAAITYTQLVAAHHTDMLGASAQRAVWAAYATQIKARHNRLHPDTPISRLRLGVVVFPQSPLGYRGAKLDGRTTRFLWYTDP